MNYYRLYFLKQGHIVGMEELHAPDDATACAMAEERSRGAPVELWRGGRRIHCYGSEAA